MDYAQRAELEQAVKDSTLAALNMLIEHNIKGADLIKKGIEQALDIKKEVESYWEILKAILNMLKPMFELVREWLVSAYNHLVAVFDWAKAKWHEIFG